MGEVLVTPGMIAAMEDVLRGELGGLHDSTYWSPGFAEAVYRAGRALEPGAGGFDRLAYQREYMRRRRAMREKR